MGDESALALDLAAVLRLLAKVKLFGGGTSLEADFLLDVRLGF